MARGCGIKRSFNEYLTLNKLFSADRGSEGRDLSFWHLYVMYDLYLHAFFNQDICQRDTVQTCNMLRLARENCFYLLLENYANVGKGIWEPNDPSHASLAFNLGGMKRWPYLTMQRAYIILNCLPKNTRIKKNRIANSLDIRISEYLEKWWLFLRLNMNFVSSTCKTLYFNKNSIDFQKICEV